MPEHLTDGFIPQHLRKSEEKQDDVLQACRAQGLLLQLNRIILFLSDHVKMQSSWQRAQRKEEQMYQ